MNDEGEFSIHNMNKAFERTPRTLLELGVLIGGLVVPALCAFFPRLRQSRVALFLPSAVLVPTALFMLGFKIDGTAVEMQRHELLMAARPSEAVEFYLYFFIFAYLIIFERRIREIETAG